MSKWLSHVKSTMKSNKGKSFSQVLKIAAKTYKKRGGGGEGAAPAARGDLGGTNSAGFAIDIKCLMTIGYLMNFITDSSTITTSNMPQYNNATAV